MAQFDFDHFEFAAALGSGSFGTVSRYKRKLAQEDDGDEYVAVKRFDKLYDEHGLLPEVLRELAALRVLIDSTHVIKLMSIHVDHENLPQMVMNSMQGTLRSVLTRTGLGFRASQHVYYMLAKGLDYIHSLGYMHRDIKEQNILCDDCDDVDRCTVKIADFGTCMRYIPGRNNTTDVGTIWYRAPEILLGDDQYSSQVDIWSLGTVYMQLVLGLNHRRHLEMQDKSEFVKLVRFINLPNEQDFSYISKLPDWKEAYGRCVDGGLDAALTRKQYNQDERRIVRSFFEAVFSYNPSSRFLAGVHPPPTDYTAVLLETDTLDRADTWEKAENLNERMRFILMDWLLSVTISWKLDTYTFQTSVNLIDRYVGMNPRITRNELQLVGSACFYIACKVFATAPPESSDFVHVSDNDFTVQMLHDMEKSICRCLEYHVYTPVLLDYVDNSSNALFSFCSNYVLIFHTELNNRRACEVALRYARAIAHDETPFPIRSQYPGVQRQWQKVVASKVELSKDLQNVRMKPRRNE